MYKYSKIGAHLNLIFTIAEQNVDKFIFKALISKKCPNFVPKMSGN